MKYQSTPKGRRASVALAGVAVDTRKRRLQALQTVFFVAISLVFETLPNGKTPLVTAVEILSSLF